MVGTCKGSSFHGRACLSRPKFIAVEGPLRVGKSTLAANPGGNPARRRIVEPENNPFLDRFYQEMSGMALATQMWFLVERYDQMRQAANDLATSPGRSWPTTCSKKISCLPTST